MNGDSVVLNIRVPEELKEKIDREYGELGYHNRSEFVRSVLRDALQTSNPADERDDTGSTGSGSKQHSRTEQGSRRDSSYRTGHTEPSGHAESEPGPIHELTADRSRDTSPSRPTVVTVGCGNIGGKVIDQLTRIRTNPIKTVALDSSKNDLSQYQADTKILVGKSITHGLGAGGDPAIGRRGAEQARDTIAEQIGHADVVVIAAGMGGGTGTGAAPVVAQIARQHGAVVISTVTRPHELDPESVLRADEGLTRLQEVANTTLVCDVTFVAEKIIDSGAAEAMSVLVQLYGRLLNCLGVSLVSEESKRLPLETFRSIFSEGQVGTVLFAETDHSTDPHETLSTAVRNKMITGDLTEASTGLLCIDTSSKTTNQGEAYAEVAAELFPNSTIEHTQMTTGYLKGYTSMLLILTDISGDEFDRDDGQDIDEIERRSLR